MARAGGKDPARIDEALAAARGFLAARLAVKVLALDYGSARTGVAVSDATGTLATPLTTIERVGSRGGMADPARYRGAPSGPGLIVVGLPRTPSGERGSQAGASIAFAGRLRGPGRGSDRAGGRAIHDDDRSSRHRAASGDERPRRAGGGGAAPRRPRPPGGRDADPPHARRAGRCSACSGCSSRPAARPSAASSAAARRPAPSVTVTIPKGAVGDRDRRRSSRRPRWSTRRRGSSSRRSARRGMQPGTYVLRDARRLRPRDRARSRPARRPRPTKKLVIPEGFAARDIAALTPKVGLPGRRLRGGREGREAAGRASSRRARRRPRWRASCSRPPTTCSSRRPVTSWSPSSSTAF